MIKLIFKFLIVSALFLTNSLSEVITKIDISGNQRISDETIFVIGKINKSKSFDNNELNNVLKNLYESNFFKDIKISIDKGVLKINLVENPIIEDIQVTGI